MNVISSTESQRRRLARGLCRYCATPPLPGRSMCEFHIEYNRIKRRAWRQAQTIK
ncbi:MAG TPA: hypothetical protein VIR57_21295 [Chloroflexota bacterium]|jgi:hypothetical protein